LVLSNGSNGKWHQAVATWNGSTISLYVDGVSDATAVSFSGSLRTNQTNSLTIGADDAAIGAGSTPLNYFNGTIDDVRIYNRALSATEVANLYHLGIVRRSFP
jgi:hypothetical protein